MPQREGNVNRRAIRRPDYHRSARRLFLAESERSSQSGRLPLPEWLRGCENVPHCPGGILNPGVYVRSASSQAALRCATKSGGINDQAATPHPRQANCLDRAIPAFRKGQSGVNPRPHAQPSAISRGLPLRLTGRRPINGRKVVRAAFSLVDGKSDTLWRIGNARQRNAMVDRTSVALTPASGAPRRSEANGSHE
jgi:hypothetical protein